MPAGDGAISTLDFDTHLRTQVQPKLLPLLDKFVRFASRLNEKSVRDVRWNPTAENLRDRFNNHIDSLLAAQVSKFALLAENLTWSVNRGDFLAYGLVGRALIEHAAVLRYYLADQIDPFLKGSIQRGYVTQEEIANLIDILDKHLRGGRFDWGAFLTGDVEALSNDDASSLLRQVNVKTCIDSWATETASVRILYNLFCDLVHPNVGSSLLVMKQWPDGIGFGAKGGRQFGVDIFDRTFAGLVMVTDTVSRMLDSLPLLRLPDEGSDGGPTIL